MTKDTRLNAHLRNQIVEKAIATSFEGREKALKKAENDLADAVYEKEFAAGAALLQAAPPEWKTFSTSVSIRHDDFDDRFYSEKPNRDLQMSESRPVPPLKGRVTLTGKLLTAADKYAKEWHKLREEKAQARDKILSLVLSVSTVKKLLEVWPEGKAFVPPANVISMLPVDPNTVKEVNKLLRLAA